MCSNGCVICLARYPIGAGIFLALFKNQRISSNPSLLKGFSVIDSSLKYDRFRILKNKIYPLLYQKPEST